MSVLSGIGQIPSVFGVGGGGGASVVYQLPADIDVIASGGVTSYIVQDLPVPNGSYLVIFNLGLVSGDNTTQILSARLANASGALFSQMTAIYNTILINGQTYSMSTSGLQTVTNGLISLEYEIDQNGNTTTLTIPEYDEASQSGVIYILPIVPPQ
jgi:hypothetical protein